MAGNTILTTPCLIQYDTLTICLKSPSDDKVCFLIEIANRGLTPASTCQDRRKLFVPAVAGREMLGVPYINRP